MLRKIVLRDPRNNQWLVFEQPVATLCAEATSDVERVLAEVLDTVDHKNLHAAGYISYEAAPGFDATLGTHARGPLPLLCFGLFGTPAVLPDLPQATRVPEAADRWTSDTAEARYRQNIRSIRRQIELGNCYQVNYTIRQHNDQLRDPWQTFLRIAHGARYAAYLETESHAIVSASPELFFSLDGDRLRCRPMKGTAARGMTLDDDHAARQALSLSSKDRAENVMITDMIRNDLGRIAVPGSVEVTSLFDIEKHPTLWQMTSSVRAKSSASIAKIIGALFPCASITGTPKVASMKLIAELEDTPRGIYTGAIGYFGPGRQAKFSVAIRTMLVDRHTQRATYGVGGGIVWDSDADAEYRECAVKSLVLTRDHGRFEILETMRWSPAEGYFLLDEHLARLARSAEYFDFTCNPHAIAERLERYQVELGEQAYRVRLLLQHDGAVGLQARPLENDVGRGTWRIRLAREPVAIDDPFLYHKTTRRGVYREARATLADCDDVLLWNPDRFITETSVANVVVLIDGEWLTPPLRCGLLAGTYRQHLLQQGRIREQPIHIEDLARADGIALINSVRGWITATLDTR